MGLITTDIRMFYYALEGWLMGPGLSYLCNVSFLIPGGRLMGNCNIIVRTVLYASSILQFNNRKENNCLEILL